MVAHLAVSGWLSSRAERNCACPPEDCGGIWGYYELLEAVANPDADGYEDMVEWLGGDFDPDAFDLEEVNAILSEWRKG